MLVHWHQPHLFTMMMMRMLMMITMVIISTLMMISIMFIIAIITICCHFHDELHQRFIIMLSMIISYPLDHFYHHFFHQNLLGADIPRHAIFGRLTSTATFHPDYCNHHHHAMILT